jgi:hypothetical protein
MTQSRDSFGCYWYVWARWLGSSDKKFQRILDDISFSLPSSLWIDWFLSYLTAFLLCGCIEAVHRHFNLKFGSKSVGTVAWILISNLSFPPRLTSVFEDFGQKSVLYLGYVSNFTQLHLIADCLLKNSSLSSVSLGRYRNWRWTVFCDTAPCSLVEIFERFRAAYCLLHRAVACLNVLTIRPETVRETSKTLFRSAGNQDYVQSRYIWNTSLERYCYSEFVDQVVNYVGVSYFLDHKSYALWLLLLWKY